LTLSISLIHVLLGVYIALVLTVILIIKGGERYTIPHRLLVLLVAPVLMILILLVFTPIPSADIIAGFTIPVVLMIILAVMFMSQRYTVSRRY